MEKRNIGKLIAGGVIIAFVFIAALMFGLPRYNVWQQEMAGKAEMAKAEQNRRILVEEAKAKLEAEKLNAQAEIERARGMAEAMKLENGTLSETYNQYLFIRTLEKLADKYKEEEMTIALTGSRSFICFRTFRYTIYSRSSSM